MGQGLGCVGLGMISFQPEKTLETSALWLTVCVGGNDHYMVTSVRVRRIYLKHVPVVCKPES